MKIISKYKDYYDSAAVYGFDESVIYKREIAFAKLPPEQKIALPQKSSFLREYTPVVHAYEATYQNLSGSHGKSYFSFKEAFLIVAGKAYSVLIEADPQNRSSLRYTYSNVKSEDRDYSQLYGTSSVDKIQKYIEDNLPDVKNLEIKRSSPRFNSYSKKEREKRNLTYKHEKEVFLNKDFTDFCVTQNATSLLILNPEEIVKNPILKNLGVEKLVDPSLMHQNIFQFISGVLGNNENKMEVISDISKVEKHGFDSRYGFRTRPKVKP